MMHGAIRGIVQGCEGYSHTGAAESLGSCVVSPDILCGDSASLTLIAGGMLDRTMVSSAPDPMAGLYADGETGSDIRPALTTF
jgi:hypothetical protein